MPIHRHPSAAAAGLGPGRRRRLGRGVCARCPSSRGQRPAGLCHGLRADAAGTGGLGQRRARPRLRRRVRPRHLRRPRRPATGAGRPGLCHRLPPGRWFRAAEGAGAQGVAARRLPTTVPSAESRLRQRGSIDEVVVAVRPLRMRNGPPFDSRCLPAPRSRRGVVVDDRRRVSRGCQNAAHAAALVLVDTLVHRLDGCERGQLQHRGSGRHRGAA